MRLVVSIPNNMKSSFITNVDRITPMIYGPQTIVKKNNRKTLTLCDIKIVKMREKDRDIYRERRQLYSHVVSQANHNHGGGEKQKEMI